MRALLLAGMLLIACSGFALADEKFVQMDQDKNNQVSWEEFQTAYPNMKRPAFEAVDTNKDSWISHEEWDAFRASHAGERSSGGMGGGMQMPTKPLPKDNSGQELPLIRPPKE